MEKKKCLLCENNAIARGLCSPHWSQWRHGLIEHPQFGKFTKSDKGAKKLLKTLTGSGETPPENPPQGKKKIKPVNHPENPPISKEDSINVGPIFSALRLRLKQSRSLAETLIIFGQGDQVKKEMDLFTQRFV
jgi:hypothetical protein